MGVQDLLAPQEPLSGEWRVRVQAERCQLSSVTVMWDDAAVISKSHHGSSY